VCAAAVLLAGCAARPYRVAPLKGLYYVYPPGHKAAPAAEERVSLANAVRARGGGTACTASGAGFALEWKGGRPIAVSRLSGIVTNGYNQEAVREAMDRFRADLEGLEERGCLKPGDAAVAMTAIAERVPVLALETVYLRYGYNRWKGYVDLRPGLNLGVQYALSRGGEAWGTSLEDLDVGMRRYSVQARPGESGVRLVRGPESVSNGVDPGPRVPDLAGSRMAYYRLFFLTKYLKIAGEPERHAVIVGAPRLADLREYSARFLEDADLTCQGKLTRTQPECIAVDKRISFLPEIQVTINGEAAHFTIGTDLRSVLYARRALGKRYSLERRYGNGWRKVAFPNGDTEALRVPLLDGDRVRY
jgi:hypothetical protein